jgi:hypothetical protein
VARYLYILSLERSGSTPLAWNLGGQPGVIALGEVDRTLALLARPVEMPRACTCGAPARDCPVWGPVAAVAGRLAGLDLAGRYGLLDRILGEHLGDILLVDASKSLESYRVLQALAPERTAAVHLVKDVRSYLDSTLGRMATMDATRLWAEQIAAHPLRARLRRAMPQSLIYLARWTRRNREMAAALEAGTAPWMRIGYDALCGEGDPALARMARLGGAGSGPGGQHILFGSFGYLDSSTDKGLRRDDRWRDSPRRMVLELAHLPVMALNASLSRESLHQGAPGARSITT